MVGAISFSNAGTAHRPEAKVEMERCRKMLGVNFGCNRMHCRNLFDELIVSRGLRLRDNEVCNEVTLKSRDLSECFLLAPSSSRCKGK